MIKFLGWLVAGLFLLITISLLCIRGVKLNHNMPGKSTIIMPEAVHTIEIPRGNGKDPIRFNIHTHERRLRIERGDQ